MDQVFVLRWKPNSPSGIERTDESKLLPASGNEREMGTTTGLIQEGLV